MFSQDRWQEIFETIQKNKLRTFLSGFTVALGIFIFVILFGFGNGLKNSFSDFFLDDAVNTLWIYPGRTSKPYRGFKSGRRIEFTNSDSKEFQEDFAHYIEYVTPRITRSTLVKYKNKSNSYTTRAVSPAHLHSEKNIMMQGRYINENDIKTKAKTVVIGRLVGKDLFGAKNPMGKYIDLGGTPFKVVGIFQDDGGDNEERNIYLPYTTRQLMEKSTDKVDQFIVAFKPQLGIVGAMALESKLMKFFKDKKNIAPSDRSAIFIRNMTENFEQNQMFAVVLQIIVSFVGLGTLIAGIIGISNIMVFVVKERTKELGIRKALGATPKDVIGMILQESIFITTIAGYVGLFLAVGLLNYVGTSLEDYFIKNPYINMGTAFFATFILIIFGGIAGYIPARKAAKIKPIVALRDE